MSSGHATAPNYFVPSPSRWPVLTGAAMLLVVFGASGWVNGVPHAAYLSVVGIAIVLYILYHWFGDAIAESEGGKYNAHVDLSYRWSMSWFIFSEVMFFAAFFGALFYARDLALPWLADIDNKVLWPDFVDHWRGTLGPAALVEPYETIPAFPIPTLNTALLLSSGVTITIAHHALIAGHRAKTSLFLFATILLGTIFLGVQSYEYYHAYTELNLKLTSGIYGSTFFMLTGFHGFHVLVGATMLSVVLYRHLKGHFTPKHHFAFEGAAWYWHFVDVVWLGLYVIVYWL